MATSSDLFIPLWWKFAKFINNESRNENITALFIMAEVRGDIDFNVGLTELLAETIAITKDSRTFLERIKDGSIHVVTVKPKHHRRLTMTEK